ncbi:MAG: tetratricopeptide repeat protein [Anaerolineales bacterium]|nr:MAG: tetratricopeptide repeat protein [Anaerolineales bacterium]
MGFDEYMLDVDEATFENEVLLRSHNVPVVVDFWAPWCGPCKILGPLLERKAIEAGGAFILARVNVDENPSLAIRYGVQGIPAVKAFHQGQISTEFVGAQPESMVRRFIDNLIPDEAAAAVEQAQSYLVARQWDEAEAAFRTVYSQDEDNAPAALGLLKSLLILGRGQEAARLIAEFPRGNEWVLAEQLKPLAKIVAEVEEDNLDPEEDPLAAEFYQAARLIVRGNLAAAMDGFLDILRQDKRYRGGEPKHVMLGIFSILGDEDSLTREYREELASVLF